MRTLLRLSAVLLMCSGFLLTPNLHASSEGDDLKAADAELNKVYQKTMDAMPSAALKAKLRDAQRAWVAFRDAEIAVNGELPGASGNILKMLQTDLTQARTKQLQDLIEASK